MMNSTKSTITNQPPPSQNGPSSGMRKPRRKQTPGRKPDQELAGRLFQLLNHLDAPSRRKHPATLTVLRLYCMQNLSVRQIALKCHCSVGTVSNRLKIIKQQTGSNPARLRLLHQT